MELLVLGSGSAFNARRQPSGYCASFDGRMAVFDLGFGNLRQLVRAGHDAADVADVFITHRHPDHVGDLAALLFLFRYDVKPKSGRLRLWGPRGFREFVGRLQAAHAPWCDSRGYELELVELGDRQTVERDGWRLEALAVPHPTPALAYRFVYKGTSLVYSGDTGFCPELADFAADSDLFLLECATSEKEAFEGHLTPRLALATLEASRCRRGLLTHLSASALEELRALRKPRGVALARDLQRVIL